jgi:hypothetical protein
VKSNFHSEKAGVSFASIELGLKGGLHSIGVLLISIKEQDYSRKLHAQFQGDGVHSLWPSNFSRVVTTFEAWWNVMGQKCAIGLGCII